jgi:hypothetical protein
MARDESSDVLNVKRRGGDHSVTVHLELPDALDASGVDPASLQLSVPGDTNHVQPEPTRLGDGGAVTDLTVKFDRQALSSALGDTAGAVSVAITGQLHGGSRLQGTGILRVIQ